MKKIALLFFLALLGNYAAAAVDFYIVSITLSPETIEEGSAAVDVDVTVRNQGDAADGYLQLTAPSLSLTQQSPSLSGEYTFAFSAIDISSWESGNYAFVAKACTDDGCTNVQSQVTKTLTIKPKKRQPVPELNELLLPLIALSVLALLFFSGRKE